MKGKRIILVVTATILFVMMAVSAMGKTNVTTVQTTNVQKKNIYYSILSDGELVLQDASLLYTNQASTVKTLYVSVGDTVKKGDPVLKLTATGTPVFDLQKETVSSLLEAFEEGEITGEEDLQTAVETLAPAETQDNTKEGEEILITAPADGTVISLPSVNSQVIPGVALGKIGDLSHLCVKAEIPEEYIGSVKEGQKVNISGSALGDAVYSGKVTSIMPYASKDLSFTGEDSKTYVDVMVALNKVDQVLRPGYSVEVKVFTDKVKNAIVLPYEAVFQEKTTEYVYKLKDGKAVRQKIETGYELSNKIQITKGLQTGDTVILNPQDVTDGEQVRIENG